MTNFFELRKKFQSNIVSQKFDCLDENIKNFQTASGLHEENKDYFTKLLLQDVYEIENSSIKIYCFSQISELFPAKGEALIHAIEYQQDDIIEHYSKSHNLNLKDQYNISPLILAITKKNIDLVKKLIDYGADINILGDYRNNAMHYAVDENDVEIAQFLISQNINLNHENEIGDTCLMRAIRGENKEIISFLCCNKENLFIHRKKKENSLQLALRELIFSSIPDNSIASMVCIQFAINFPENINEFKGYDGYELIKKEVDSILNNIELENKLQIILNSKKSIKHNKI